MIRFMHNIFWILLSAILCFGLSAIQAAAQNKTACQLITKVELESVTGYKLQPPQVIPAWDINSIKSKKDDKDLKDLIASQEIASSGCSYQLTPASQAQTLYENSIIQIGVRYLRNADAEGFRDKFNDLSGVGYMWINPNITFPYPALFYAVNTTAVAFKETSSGTIMLEIKCSIYPKSMTVVDGAYFSKDMDVKIALKIFGDAGTLPGTPNSQVLSADDSLKGINGMIVDVYLNGELLSAIADIRTDMVNLLRQNGIKVISRNNATTLPTLQLDIDTLYVSQFNGPGFVVYTTQLKFLQIFPAQNQKSSAKFVQVLTWSVGSFGINGSDRYRKEAAGLTSQFIKSYFNVNGKK